MAGDNGGGFIAQKNKAAVWVDGLIYMFTSNDERLFDVDESVWKARVYRYKLKPLPDDASVWFPKMRNMKIFPKSLLLLFADYDLMEEVDKIL